jgi:predicted metal-dependent hydrolase
MRRLLYVVIIISLIVILFIFSNRDNIEKFTISNSYTDSDSALDKLVKLDESNRRLISYLNSKYHNTELQDDINFLKKNYKPFLIEEYDPSYFDTNTSFVIGKGSQYKLCLRDKKTKKLHSDEILMFVNLHELSHLMNRTLGHGDDFWRCFKLILENAVEIGIYKPVNYYHNPQKYCGIEINQNPLFWNF